MNFVKRILWGLLIWAIMFMWVTVLMFGFKMTSGILMSIFTWIAAIIVVWFIAKAAKIKNAGDGFMVGIIFVIVGVLMDWFVTTKFSPAIFSSWSLWLGYGLTLLIPILRGLRKK